jgi:choline dehydrogenase-like flavoprotein
MTNLGLSMGPDALREPFGPLPADPADDANLPPELEAARAEAERQVTEWATTGQGLASSSMYEACAWYSTGLGDDHTHDAQLGMFICGYSPDLWRNLLRIDPDAYFGDAEAALNPDAENIILLANPVKPHSRGEVVLNSTDPLEHPEIRMNYFGDSHDMDVMVSVVRKCLELVDNWPDPEALGPLFVPPALAEKHGHESGDTPSDELIMDMARHYAGTVYHLSSTCRIGDVVDSRLRVDGVAGLRVADASVMPDVISGNTNAPVMMIGEKAAEMLAAEHGYMLRETVGAS